MLNKLLDKDAFWLCITIFVGCSTFWLFLWFLSVYSSDKYLYMTIDCIQANEHYCERYEVNTHGKFRNSTPRNNDAR